MSASSAFLSYSHADLGVARTLHKELSGLLRGQFGRPRIRVLRDETALTPGDDLPRRIQAMIDQADWLIVLLGADSGRSEWVTKEVAHWRADPERADRVLVVSLRPGLSFDLSRGLTAPWLRPDLGALFETEPLFVSLDPASATLALECRNGAVLLAAAMLGVTPEDVESEERRLRRSRQRAVAVAATALTVLTVIAVVAGVGAVRAQGRAEAEARRSFSGYLGAQALLAAPSAPDTAGELVVAADRLDGSIDDWVQMAEVIQRLPADFDAQRLPLDPTEAELSPDGSSIAVVGTAAAGDPLLVVAGLGADGSPMVTDLEPDHRPADVAWLDDGRVVALDAGDYGTTAAGTATLSLVDATGRPLSRLHLDTPDAYAVAVISSDELLVVTDELLRVDVGADGTLRIGDRALLPPSLSTEYGVGLHIADGRFWLAAGTIDQVLTGRTDDPTLSATPWVGGRRRGGLPTSRVGGPWEVGSAGLLLHSLNTVESGRRGGSVFLVHRGSRSVDIADSLAVGDSVADLCVTTGGGSGPLVATAARGERLLQAQLAGGRFASQRTYRIDSVVAVACSDTGRTAWVTADGLVLTSKGVLLGETGGLQWMDAGSDHSEAVVGSAGTILRDSVLAASGGRLRLDGPDGPIATGYESGGSAIGSVLAGDHPVTSCLALGWDPDAAEPGFGGTWRPIIGQVTNDGVLHGDCEEWEVRVERAEGHDRLRLWRSGRATEIAGFDTLAVDERAGYFIADGRLYAIDGDRLVPVEQLDPSAGVIAHAYLSYEGGVVVGLVDVFEQASVESAADLWVRPVSASAMVDYLCGRYATGSLDEFARAPTFRGEPGQLAGAGCR